MDTRVAEHMKREIIRLCRNGLEPRALWGETLKRLRRVVPVDAAFFGTADPATQLFTSSVAEGALQPARPWFLQNEFLHDDVNKFTSLARQDWPVGSLYEATRHQMERSPRYRDILVPLAMGDELRVVLRSHGTVWGFLCLHRERSSPHFTHAESKFLGQLSPYLAEAIHTGIVLSQTASTSVASDEPGVLLLAKDLAVTALTPAAERWLNELSAEDFPPCHHLPFAIKAVAMRLRATRDESAGLAEPWPQVRLRTRSGRWLVLHASWLSEPQGEPQMAIIMEAACPWEIAPVIVQAYELSPREQHIAQWVMRGLSTAEMATTLRISRHTVQDHLKKIFDKVGVHSRRELVAQVFAQHYEPHIQEGRGLSSHGWFTRPR